MDASLFLLMALLDFSSLLIYLEIDEADPLSEFSLPFLVGLFDAPDAAQIGQHTAQANAWAAKSWFARQFTPKPTRAVSQPVAVCKAAAYLWDSGNFLIIRNVGAEQGFGPMLYATVLELARARGRQGVIPSTEPDKILEKPKRIWERFSNGPEYQGRVLTNPGPGHHPEAWLNKVYCLAPGASLLDYEGKRAEWKAYDAFWKASNTVRYWRGHSYDMARRSVEAHISGTHH